MVIVKQIVRSFWGKIAIFVIAGIAIQFVIPVPAFSVLVWTAGLLYLHFTGEL